MPHLEFSALTLLLAQIGAILLVSRLLGIGTRWLGQPLVIAEVLAGIVLGPSLLGLLYPEAMAALFPAKSLPVLQLLSQIGLVLFMFLVGLELDPKLLRGRAHTSVLISHTSIVLPFALGALAAFWLRDSHSSPDVPFVSFLLFLGAAMSVTAFPVLARILSERHLLTSRVGAISITCAAVGDVTAWCILAFVVSVARAGSISDPLVTTGLAAVFIVAMLLVVRPFLRRLGARVASREGLTPTVVAIILLLLITSASATELIGIHALFGAFLFGAILPKEGRLAETLADRLETVAVILLLPLFFAYSGLRTELGLLRDPAEWAVALALIALATLGKFGGSAVAARLTGLGWREASAIGILMNTRGLMELIVLNLGMDLGVISPTIFTMLVIMALVTTFATTPLLAWVYPASAVAREVRPVEVEAAPAARAPFTVLLCVSDRTTGPSLATVAAALLGPRNQPARLLALHLWRSSDRPSLELRRGDAGTQEGPLAALVERARALALDVQPLEFVSADPAGDICRTAATRQASLVLLGSHKPLLLEGRLGGTVRDVVEQASCPVAVLLDRGLLRLERVLVAFAGGAEDLAALQLARRIAAAPGCEVSVLHVVAPGGTGSRAALEPGLEPGRVRVVEHASPAEAVLLEVQRGYDLVVLGMHARWGLGTGPIRRFRQRGLHDAPVSLLAVHPPLGVAAESVAHERPLAPSPSA